MARNLVQAPRRAKFAAKSRRGPEFVRLTMTADDLHEQLSTLRWLDEISPRPSDVEIDLLRAEIVADWLREMMLDVTSAHVSLSLPSRDDVRQALAERRACQVIDFASAAARLRSRESAAV